jgi:predicted GIY-YIG superfamily endonuclease
MANTRNVSRSLARGSLHCLVRSLGHHVRQNILAVRATNSPNTARFQQHVQGDSCATSYRGPWKLIYYEAYLERDDALGRERYLKSGSGRKFLKTQLRHYLKKNPFAA